MCKKAQLRLELTIFYGLMLVSALVSVALGGYLIVDTAGQIAYGLQVKNWGGVLIFTCLLLFVVVCFGMFGTRRHNKFALSAAICCNTLAAFVIFVIGATIFLQVAPKFSVSVARDCVARGMEGAPISSTCMAYYKDLGNIRLFRLWMHNYVESQTVKEQRATMLDIEDKNYCCGWGPPVQCMNTNGGNFSLDGNELLKSDRPILEALNRCSRHKGWYQTSLLCRKVDADFFAGCPYMFSSSTECRSDTTTRPGCAAAFQTIQAGKFRAIGGTLLGIVLMEFITMVLSCCYCFKRKYTDVLPPYTPFSADRFEKFRYGVKGQDDEIHVVTAEDKFEDKEVNRKPKDAEGSKKPDRPPVAAAALQVEDVSQGATSSSSRAGAGAGAGVGSADGGGVEESKQGAGKGAVVARKPRAVAL